VSSAGGLKERRRHLPPSTSELHHPTNTRSSALQGPPLRLPTTLADLDVSTPPHPDPTISSQLLCITPTCTPSPSYPAINPPFISHLLFPTESLPNTTIPSTPSRQPASASASPVRRHTIPGGRTYTVRQVLALAVAVPVEMNDMNCLIVKLSNLEQASHNIEGLKQRLKGLCECKESSMHAHGGSHQFSKLRIPRCLQTGTHLFIQQFPRRHSGAASE